MAWLKNSLLFRLLSTSTVIARKLDSHAHPPFKLPSSKNNRWVERQPFNKMYEYTTDPLPFPSTGGRGPNGMYCQLCFRAKLQSGHILFHIGKFAD